MTASPFPTLTSGARAREPQIVIAWVVIVVSIIVTLIMISMGDEAGSPPPADAVAREAAPGQVGSSRAVLGWVLLALLGFALGTVLCVQAVRRLAAGRWVSRMGGAHPRHGFYVEAFALWLVLGMPVGIVLSAAKGWTGLPVATEDALIHPLGLLVLLWPLWRGVPLSGLCEDLGLQPGAGILREMGAGLVGYIAKWPLLALGLAGTFLLSELTRAEGEAFALTHPVTEALRLGGGAARIPILVMAIVLAPLLEEVVFRGLLLRHLRSVIGPASAVRSGVAGAAISGLIFALIHPQGLLAVPALLAEGFAIALVRDWRGSLIAPLVMHAVHNAVFMAFLV
jgi:membrane protease YdiL (CAAX protease family)